MSDSDAHTPPPDPDSQPAPAVPGALEFTSLTPEQLAPLFPRLEIGEAINPLSPHLRSPQPRTQQPHLKSKFLAAPDFTDLHNLRPCDVATNSARGNRFFDDAGARSWEPPDDEKGDIARSMFYMAIRYEGGEERTVDLELADSPASGSGNFGKLSTLLRWHQLDPPDDTERERNRRVEALQGNRNPFVDTPGLVAEFWGN